VTAYTLKNLPAELHERLRERADRNHRSLNSEILACLRAVVMAERVEPSELLAVARRAREGVGGRLTAALLDEAKATGRP
jgi:plasmid stability protein